MRDPCSDKLDAELAQRGLVRDREDDLGERALGPSPRRVAAGGDQVAREGGVRGLSREDTRAGVAAAVGGAWSPAEFATEVTGAAAGGVAASPFAPAGGTEGLYSAR